jgi:hypothetical protein
MPDTGHYTDSAQADNPEHFATDLAERPDMTAAVIVAFRDGLGVEDIGVMGIAPASYARAVLKRLTAMGLTDSLYRKGKAKKPNNQWRPIGGLAASLVDEAARKMEERREVAD